MAVDGWRYYNHAMVPTCAIYERPNLNPLRDGSIWSEGALIARYTTDFDCIEDTSYWYVIKERPFDINTFTSKCRNNIKRALKRCEARRIIPAEYAEEIWEVTEAAFQAYENAANKPTRETFIKGLQRTNLEYWGAFNKETGIMAGWICCRNNGDYTETVSAKYHPQRQGFNRPSDVLHYAILDYYLNELHQRFVCSGARNINHKTNVQEYEIGTWKYRKVYCKLHIEYRVWLRYVIMFLYPFRTILHIFNNNTIGHQINSLLLLEKLARECRRQKKNKRNRFIILGN